MARLVPCSNYRFSHHLNRIQHEASKWDATPYKPQHQQKLHHSENTDKLDLRQEVSKN